MQYKVGIPPLGQGPTWIVLDHRMVEIIVRVEVSLPNRSLIWMWTKDSKENIHCVLLLGVGKSVGVISPHSLHDVVALTRPWRLLPVGLDPVDEGGAPVLEGQGVPVVFVHLLQHPHTVSLNLQPGSGQNT